MGVKQGLLYDMAHICFSPFCPAAANLWCQLPLPLPEPELPKSDT